MKIERIKTIIADDNKGMLELMKKMLDIEKNIEILAVIEDGNKELELIKKIKPNLVITDLYRKNGISGLEVIKRVREYDYNLTFLIITSSYYERELELLKEDKKIYIIRKPINWEKFNAKIQEIIKKMQNKKASFTPKN